MKKTKRKVYPETGFYWHVHHMRLMEWMTGYRERKEYILRNKPSTQKRVRLRLMQPVNLRSAPAWLKKLAEASSPEFFFLQLEAHKRSINLLHKKQCKDCPWNGYTIFPHG